MGQGTDRIRKKRRKMPMVMLFLPWCLSCHAAVLKKRRTLPLHSPHSPISPEEATLPFQLKEKRGKGRLYSLFPRDWKDGERKREEGETVDSLEGL